MTFTGAAARNVDVGAVTHVSAHEAGIDALMRELIHRKPAEGRSESTASTDNATKQSAPRRDFDMATELLGRAGQAFDLLIDRCEILEHDLDDANDRAQTRAIEQDQTIEQWKQVAAKLQAQLETTEQAIVSMRTHCDNVQARAVKAEATVKALEASSLQAANHAALAESLTTKLHDKVVAAFGIGSRAHPVLQAVATKEAAE